MTTDIESTLQALTERVETLERERCGCQLCSSRAREREEYRLRDRALKLERMAPAERAATILALTTQERHMLLPLVVDRVALALSLPKDMRDECMTIMRMSNVERTRVEIADVVLPPRVSVSYTDPLVLSGHRAGSIRAKSIPLDEDDAAALKALGLAVHQAPNGTWWCKRPALVHTYAELLATTWAAMLEIDDELRAAVEAKTIAVTDVPRAELEGIEIRSRQKKEEDKKYRSHVGESPRTHRSVGGY